MPGVEVTDNFNDAILLDHIRPPSTSDTNTVALFETSCPPEAGQQCALNCTLFNLKSNQIKKNVYLGSDNNKILKEEA